MLKNPYSHIVNSGEGYNTGLRIQCDIDPNDKVLLTSLRPQKGTLQLVINNLLKNLCDDLRKLNIDTWRPDGDEVLAFLTESRTIPAERLIELSVRCPSIKLTEAISSGVFNGDGSTGVREEATNTEVESSNSEVRTSKGKSRNRKTTKENQTQTDQHEK
jgi:hypothetical protein